MPRDLLARVWKYSFPLFSLLSLQILLLPATERSPTMSSKLTLLLLAMAAVGEVLVLGPGGCASA